MHELRLSSRHGNCWGALAVLCSCACATETSGLAQRSAGAAGAEGSASGEPIPEVVGVSSGKPDGGAAGPGAGAGLGSIAIVHGVVDGGRLFACVRQVTSSGTSWAQAPVPAEGLGFAEVHSLPTDWELSSDALEVELFTALPTQVDGLGCDALLAGLAAPVAEAAVGRDAGSDAGSTESAGTLPGEPRQPRRAGSVSFPAGALRAGARYALVSAGCAASGAPPSEEMCGPPDGLFGSHRALVLAELGAGASLAANDLSLRFLNASRAVRRADLVLQSNDSEQAFNLASDVRFGALRPLEPARVAEPLGLVLHADGDVVATYTQTWGDTLGSGAPNAESGGDYVVVYVGPAPGTAAAVLAPPRFALIAGAD